MTYLYSFIIYIAISCLIGFIVDKILGPDEVDFGIKYEHGTI